jgi:hypothetical protein
MSSWRLSLNLTFVKSLRAREHDYPVACMFWVKNIMNEM